MCGCVCACIHPCAHVCVCVLRESAWERTCGRANVCACGRAGVRACERVCVWVCGRAGVFVHVIISIFKIKRKCQYGGTYIDL